VQLGWGDADYLTTGGNIYLFPFAAVNIVDRREQNRAMSEKLYSYTHIFECDGWIYPSVEGDQLSVSIAMQELIDALSIQNQDLVFFDDDGVITATILQNRTSISGVKIEVGPDFPENMGGEYNVQRRFRFRASAEYAYPNTKNLLLEFNESLQFSGGAPKFVVRPAVEGFGQRQLAVQVMPYLCTQTGFAIGYTDYPQISQVAPPKFPRSLLEAPEIVKETPKRRGQGYQNFKISWIYRFGDIIPLSSAAKPNLWPANR
jgi:hypothetical protein